MKLLVCGGRTGGHLIPGIAIYEEARRRGMDTRYVMSAFDLNYPVTSRVAEKDRILVDLRHISRRISWKTPLYILKILGAFVSVLGQIRKFRPDAVIVTGGYISNPVSLAALVLRIPLFIEEQNSVAGVTNRFYARFARRIFTAFPKTLNVPERKCVLTGNPTIHRGNAPRSKARSFFGMGQFAKIIGITGGSQGAKALNDAVLTILPEMKKRKIGILWSVGSVDFKRLEETGRLELIRKDYPNVRVKRFISRMDLFLSASNAVISRAGATSISEFVRFGTPSLLVPISRSPDDHQLRNAQFLHREGSAVIIEEKDLNRNRLISELDRILKTEGRFRKGLAGMKKKYYRRIPEEIILEEIQKSMAY